MFIYSERTIKIWRNLHIFWCYRVISNKIWRFRQTLIGLLRLYDFCQIQLAIFHYKSKFFIQTHYLISKYEKRSHHIGLEYVWKISWKLGAKKFKYNFKLFFTPLCISTHIRRFTEQCIYQWRWCKSLRKNNPHTVSMNI